MKPVVFSVVCALLAAGCATTSMPTARQVQFNIPSALLECPGLPRSPGAGASERQTAVYIVALYSAANRCRQNNGAVRQLYQQYRGEIQRLSGVVKRAAQVAEKRGKKPTQVARAASKKRYVAQRDRKVAAAW